MNQSRIGLLTITPVPQVKISAFRMIAIEQDAVRGAVQVLVLSGPQRPQKHPQATPAKHEGSGDQPKNDGHVRARKLLPMTSNDDPDIAAAASQGVTNPATASGTINEL